MDWTGQIRSGDFIRFGLAVSLLMVCIACHSTEEEPELRQKISLNEGWRFFKYDSLSQADSLRYDIRPEIADQQETKPADAKPTEAVLVSGQHNVLKAWILPSANAYIKDSAQQYIRPDGHPGSDFPFVQADFDDHLWQKVDLPHDWAIGGPFQTGWDSEVGGGMGRLPVNGVAWYRKSFEVPLSDQGRSVFLEVEGAMSYAMVWINGKLAGGWPYGYNSWQLDLTPYLNVGGENQLAIRLDNPNYSARWYPGGGLYRKVWLIKTDRVHVARCGTFMTTPEVTREQADLDFDVSVENGSEQEALVEVSTSVYQLDDQGRRSRQPVTGFEPQSLKIEADKQTIFSGHTVVRKPKLWGPPPEQQPHLYVAVTVLSVDGRKVDIYETPFGIRQIDYHPEKGISVNGIPVRLQGVNQHHDLGALGAAFNRRAAERQLELLREMGCNAIRMSHNPPAPELLELTDRMGFLVVDEIFDSWERKKTPHDFHLIFPEWSEADTRAFIRRDRNHPSVIMWSFGNEVGEQYTAEDGAKVARRLYDFIREEDSTRPATLAMNFAKPDMELPVVPDVIGLNYQGEGIRQEPEFEGTERIRTKPQYTAFHEKFPDKVIFSSETASAFSSRGVYLFPVTPAISSPTRDGRGGNSQIGQVSSYELYAVDFGSSADKVFGSLERHPFVAGEFVWTGWDYLGEPTPYYQARSSYTGILDLAGFKKDRFYLYQSHWRPDYPMVHILPHWNWPDRVSEVTPVHVFTSGDEAELFLNGKSMGRKKKEPGEYRLRWDDVKYQPGEVRVVAYRNGQVWAEEQIRTTGEATQLQAQADREVIAADGADLSFVTLKIVDEQGLTVPGSEQLIDWSVEGPGEIVATDNGNPMDMTSFLSPRRKAFNGMALVIVRSEKGQPGKIILKATSPNLKTCSINLYSK